MADDKSSGQPEIPWREWFYDATDRSSRLRNGIADALGITVPLPSDEELIARVRALYLQKVRRELDEG